MKDYIVTDQVDASTRVAGRRVRPGQVVQLTPAEAAGEEFRGTVVAQPAPTPPEPPKTVGK